MDLLLGFLAVGGLYGIIMLATHHWEGEPTPPNGDQKGVTVDEVSTEAPHS